MKILILSTFERNGGAAVAANRLMHALNKAGHEAKMLVRDKQTDDENVVSINTNWLKKKLNFLRFAYERWVIFVQNRFSRKNLFAVSIANTGTDISYHPLVKAADIIHLHWVNQGFLSLKDIEKLTKLGKPIVWTMHDMCCFTGICHYVGTCNRYQMQCHDCSFLQHPTDNDLSLAVFEKKTFFTNKINYVGCSHWIAACAKQSSLLKNAAITNIPNPIDITQFQPIEKQAARQKLMLPTGKKLILFASVKLSDTRKGMAYFVETCRQLAGSEIEIVFFGGQIDENIVHTIPLNTNHLGYLKTPADIAAAYSACDIFVIPSLEDNLPNTIMESMACGTPCVGFDVGGIPEMIDHQKNGYVAQYKNAEDLAKGILFCLENNTELSANAREKVLKTYAEDIVAQQYLNLYNGK
ncbi:glycosyl transferase [Bacteroidia bacterium]|nr:glycosyl transferase [Bacteroidia bacterium]